MDPQSRGQEDNYAQGKAIHGPTVRIPQACRLVGGSWCALLTSMAGIGEKALNRVLGSLLRKDAVAASQV